MPTDIDPSFITRLQEFLALRDTERSRKPKRANKIMALRKAILDCVRHDQLVHTDALRELKALVKERAEIQARIDREWKLLMVRETELTSELLEEVDTNDDG